jgi:hypothetical protein
MNVSYTITGSEFSGTQILVVINGNPHTVTEAHPNFERIREALFDGEYDSIEHLVNVQRSILMRLSDNVTISGDTIYYRDEPLYSRLASTMLEFYRKGRDFKKLVNFMERLFANPSKHSRTQLFEFLDRHNFAITEDGHFLAYKGVKADFGSITFGPGIVNGESVTGSLDNTPGNTVEMLRTEVMDDPSVACAEGLHAGTWEYASSFGPVVVEVKIDPADVVSVPHDSNFQKIRTERYVVIRKVDRPVDAESRYDMTDEFMEWLSVIASAYTRKGRVAPSYEVLVERFIEGLEDEPSQDSLESLYSLAAELDSAHDALSVYRYHIEQVLYEYQSQEDEDEDDALWDIHGYDEDDEEYEEEEDEDYEEEEEESHYGW